MISIEMNKQKIFPKLYSFSFGSGDSDKSFASGGRRFFLGVGTMPQIFVPIFFFVQEYALLVLGKFKVRSQHSSTRPVSS